MKADLHNIKKQLEILIIDYFRSANSGFPNGKLKASESPDFVLATLPKNKIGIELTRLYFDNSDIGENEVIHNIGREIVSKACEFFEMTSSWKLFVKVSFSDKCKVMQEKQLLLSVLIANAIKESVKAKKAGSFFSIYLTENLPDEIDGIFMAAHPSLSSSVWEVAGFSKKSFEIAQLIRQLISKKEDKLRLYQKQRLNQYWLIITVDRLNKMQSNKLNSFIFNSGNSFQFQKIFLFDLLKARIFQIF